MTESNLVPYGSYDADEAAKEREDLDQEKRGNFIKLGVGTHQLRILPPPEGRKTPFWITHLHYINPPGQQHATRVSCPRLGSKGKKRCPVCERVAELDKSGNPVDRDLAKDLFAGRQVYCNVIDRKAPERGIQTWSFRQTIHDWLNDYVTNKIESCDFTHPMEGYDIIVTRRGTGQTDTRWSVKLALKPSKLSKTIEEMNALMTGQPNLDRYTSLPSDEDIIAIMEGKQRERGRLSSGTSQRKTHTVASDAEDEYNDPEIVNEDDY